MKKQPYIVQRKMLYTCTYNTWNWQLLLSPGYPPTRIYLVFLLTLSILSSSLIITDISLSRPFFSPCNCSKTPSRLTITWPKKTYYLQSSNLSCQSYNHVVMSSNLSLYYSMQIVMCRYIQCHPAITKTPLQRTTFESPAELQ